MQLWSGVLSPFSAKVRIALAEKGLDFEILEIPWSRRNLWGPKPPEFLAVSPLGQVPVLVDGGAAIVDSTLICEYLEETAPQVPLFPREPVARARCRLLEDAADTAMKEHVTALIQEVFMKPDGAGRDAARASAATSALGAFYDRLEAELRAGPYLCGDFGVADIAAFLVVGFASTLGVPPGEFHPALSAWSQRVSARPSVAREFEAITRAAAAV